MRHLGAPEARRKLHRQLGGRPVPPCELHSHQLVGSYYDSISSAVKVLLFVINVHRITYKWLIASIHYRLYWIVHILDILYCTEHTHVLCNIVYMSMYSDHPRNFTKIKMGIIVTTLNNLNHSRPYCICQKCILFHSKLVPISFEMLTVTLTLTLGIQYNRMHI